jgi:hypothetical protein
MPDSMLYQDEDMFVLLEPGQPERFLTPTELRQHLQSILQVRQDDLPRDLQKLDTVEQQAQYLVENSCSLDLEPGRSLQWYVVRLEK